MSLKQRFKAITGRALFLEWGKERKLEDYLRKRGWMSAAERLISCEKPGEGNMNFVLRAKTPHESLIIKQARPWVEKYPDIEAPLERIQVEAAFYKLIQQDELLASFTPGLLDWDPSSHIMILEDLGKSADYTFCYKKEKAIKEESLKALVAFLSHLHNREFDAEVIKKFPLNQALKKLNHQHIFQYPYLEENGFDLDTVQEGLQALSMSYKTDEELKSKIQSLGEHYLGTGPCLLHGDFYPGSWLKVDKKVKVIDPEFGCFGRPEFDLGVMIAHLKMAQAPEESIDLVLKRYQKPSGFDDALRTAFTGVEIMRRIIGLAQLPLDLSLEEKDGLMKEALTLLK